MCEQCTRREFMGTGVASGLMLAGANWSHAWASQSPPPPSRGKSRICVIFTGQPAPSDRDWGADTGQIRVMKARLANAEKDLGNVKLIMGQSNSTEQTSALLKKAGPGVPVLTINVRNFALTRVVKPNSRRITSDGALLASCQRSRLDVCSPLAQPGTSRHSPGQQQLRRA